MARAYGVLAVGGLYSSRHTVYVGADGKILEIDRKVSPKTAGADVATKLEQFGVARRETN